MHREIELYIAAPEITVVEAMQQIDKGAKGILFLVDEAKHLVGCVTDGDIRRWLITTADLNASVSRFMVQSPTYIFELDDIDAEAYMKRLSITALPVLDAQRRIVDLVFINSKERLQERKDTRTLDKVPVVIMAGGKGTRLYPYTKILPKPLIPIEEIPIIERIMDRFVMYGANEFYLTVNYKKGMIKSYFDELQPCYHVVYVEEDKPLGTAGSLRLITDKFDCPLFVTNCDILIDADYGYIYKQHVDSGNSITIVSALKTQQLPYGILQLDEQGVVSGIEEKPSLSHFVNTGMYIIDSAILNLIPEDTYYHMPQLIEEVIRRRMKVGMYPVGENAFLDMGELEEMRRMEEKLRVK